MSAPDTHQVVLQAPRRDMTQEELYKFLYELWKRTGTYNSNVVDLNGLAVNAVQLNTLVDIRTGDTVQQQIDSKESIAKLRTMAYQDSDDVSITGGKIIQVTIADSAITIPVNTTSLDLKLGGTLFTNSVDVGNDAGVETDLTCYPMGPNTLATQGQFLEVISWGIFAASGTPKRIRLKLGTTILLDTGSGPTPSNGAWVLKATILVNDATSQKCIANIFSPATSMVEYAISTDSTEDLTTPLDVCITGEAGSADDIVQKGLIIEWFDSGV